MLDRTEKRLNLKPKRLAAHTAYGIGKFLGWLVEQKKISPHILVSLRFSPDGQALIISVGRDEGSANLFATNLTSKAVRSPRADYTGAASIHFKICSETLP